MSLFLFFVLAGLVADMKCDLFSNPNFIVEMPEDNSKDIFKKQFKVYWNVPTMQCKSKKIPFDNLFEKFGIIQNEKDSFRGDKIAILYDPGLFPALLKNETSGELKFRNGGVPQEGDLEKHVEVFRTVLNQSIPNPNFDGVGIIDFESWRPIFRQNFGILVLYKDVSYDIERKRHWWWPSEMVKSEAISRFEKAAQEFMLTTLTLAKKMRPKALWGYYGFPYCFNGGVSTCSRETRQENDRSHWMLESSALYPSVYSKQALNTKQLQDMIKGRVQEAARVKKRDTIILPYFWYRYRDGGFFSEVDLKAALKTFYATDTSGFIIWGSSNDVNSVEKCQKLLNYVEQIFGPAIAKYTKINAKVEYDEVTTEFLEPILLELNVTTKEPDSKEESSENKLNENETSEELEDNAPVLDTEALLKPDNHTQDVIKYVEEEFVKQSGFNVTFDERDEERILEVVEEKTPDTVVKDMLNSAKEHNVDSDLNSSKDLAKTKVSDIEDAITKEKAYESKMNESQLINLLRNNEQIELLKGNDIYTTTDTSYTRDDEEITTVNYSETEFNDTIISTTNDSGSTTEIIYETTTDFIALTTDIIELEEYYEVINETNTDEDLLLTSTVTYETSTNYNDYTTVTDDDFSIITDSYDINDFNVEKDRAKEKHEKENSVKYILNEDKEDNITSVTETTGNYETNYLNRDKEKKKEKLDENSNRVTGNEGYYNENRMNATTGNNKHNQIIEDKNNKKDKSNQNSKRDINKEHQTTEFDEDYTFSDVTENGLTTENMKVKSDSELSLSHMAVATLDSREMQIRSMLRKENQGSSGESTTHYGRKHLFCIIFYFYSVSKCLCEMYNEC